MNNKKITLTQHACARMRENGLTKDKVYYLWMSAQETAMPVKRLMYKFMKYGVDSLRTVKYFRSQNYLFTVGVQNPSRPVVITITKM